MKIKSLKVKCNNRILKYNIHFKRNLAHNFRDNIFILNQRTMHNRR